jgi:hypothetical protein
MDLNGCSWPAGLCHRVRLAVAAPAVCRLAVSSEQAHSAQSRQGALGLFDLACSSARAFYQRFPPLALGPGGESLTPRFRFLNPRWWGLAKPTSVGGLNAARIPERASWAMGYALSRPSFARVCAGALRPSSRAGRWQSWRSGRVDLGNIASKELHDRGFAMVDGVGRDQNRGPGLDCLRKSI